MKNFAKRFWCKIRDNSNTKANHQGQNMDVLKGMKNLLS